MPAPTSAFESIANAIKTAFETEFTVEGFKMSFDNLHESLGRHRVEVGIAPSEERATLANRVTGEHWVEVKFYGLWTDEISPDTVVNPTKITGYAERFKDALREAQDSFGGTGRVWYFDVDRIQYPNDPTGNKTRFVATIRAFGNNSNLIETTS